MLQFALPNRESAEAHPLQITDDALIALPICLELRSPEGPVSLRHRRARALCMSVPEAPVNEHRPAARPVRQIRCAGEIAIVDAEPASKTMKDSTNHQLGTGVTLRNLSEPRRRS